MRHLLPDLQQLMHTDFLVLHHDDHTRKDITDIAAFVQNTPDTSDRPVFYKDGTDWHYITTKGIPEEGNLGTLDHLPWQKIIAVHEETPVETLIQHMNEHDMLLIENGGQQPAGYVQARTFLQEIYHSYQALAAYFETMVQTTDASISIIDENYKTIAWTQGAEELFSVKQEEILGKKMTDYFPPDMLQTLKTFESGEVVQRRQHQPRPDLFVLINSRPVKLNGEIIGAVAAETDITSQVRLNRELFNANTKVSHLEQEIEKLKPSPDPFHKIKGSSSALKQTKEKIRKVGETKATALILGESGVGKELFAKAIHDMSEDPDAPFIPINCGAIPPSLFESELFGYEKGAFSGANQKGKKGKVELASGGTLFLDEIAELPLEMQVKLLRVLQEKKFFPVGGTQELKMNARIIAATNRDLEELVQQEKFREDLYYRLNVITIAIPPLRDRKEDIIELTHTFLHEFSIRYNKVIEQLPHTIMQDLLNHDWPGNIRELRNTIERLVVFSTNGTINREDLPFAQESAEANGDHDADKNAVNDLTALNHDPKYALEILPHGYNAQDAQGQPLTLQQAVDHFERQVLLKTLEEVQGNKIAAAKRLGISRATLYNKLNKLGIENEI